MVQQIYAYAGNPRRLFDPLEWER